mmetsp:Transcript_71503/g.192540  ORF Transcript_71503/g.192540 Transcript_71503/m.192540 type:complete len:288 (-) Transcript_71503:836-1699(-)
MRLQGRVQRDVRQHGRRGLHIHGVEDVVSILRSDARVGVHPDAALPLAVRVQQRTLHVHHRFGCDVLLHVEGYGKGLVGVAVRNHEQVCTSDEQVAVELRDLPAPGDADSHDGLPPHVPRQHVLQLVSQLQARRLYVEVRVVTNVATGVLRERRYGSQVDVLLRSKEHLHRDLRARELGAEVLVALAHRSQKLDLSVCAQQSRVVPGRLQGKLAHARDAGTEDEQLAADVLHGHESTFHGGAHARLVGLRVPEHRGQGVQERVDLVSALREGHQNVIGQRQEEVLQV